MNECRIEVNELYGTLLYLALSLILSGEFGIVYKAHLFDFLDNSDITTVAVKTLKGICYQFSIFGISVYMYV